jgi:beta-lactamase class D
MGVRGLPEYRPPFERISGRAIMAHHARSPPNNFMAQNRNRHWTIEDDSRLRELASRSSFFDIAIELGRDLAAVKARAQQLQLWPGREPSFESASQDAQGIDRRSKRSWTELEVRALKELSRTESIEQIAKQLDRSVSSVKLKAYWLNLPLGRR